jgi:hypothetical protein
LGATGSQTLQVTDNADQTIGGGTTITVHAAVAAAQLLVLTPEHATAGVPTTAAVIALDATGHWVPNYTGTVHFTSSDPQATLPVDYSFNARDRGRHTFQVTFQTTGAQAVIATDTVTNSITGQASVTVEPVGIVTHFGVFSLGPTLAGFPTPVVVVALDASNHVVPGYTGTVHFSSTDSQAILPADYTFSVSDNGAHLFSVTFATRGQQTLTVTDLANPTSTGSFNFRVLSRLMRRIPLLEEWVPMG